MNQVEEFTTDDKDENDKKEEENVNPSELGLCGLGSWRPPWLQKLANHYVFSFTFIVVGIVQGMSYSYFNGMITTLEKVFHVSSSTMGYILAGNDISQILCGLILTHVANKGNRPVWMATGMMIGASACFIYASAQLFWEEKPTVLQSNGTTTYELCSWNRLEETSLKTLNNNNKNDANCFNDEHNNWKGAAWLFLGQFISGVGGTVSYALGFAYMDDNIKKRNSPFYIGLTSSMRSLGPALGYLLASLSLKIYIKPSDVPEYDSKDPRWLGAWWMGFIIIGVLQMLFTFPLLLFPNQLPKSTTKGKTSNGTNNRQPKNSPVNETESAWKDFGPTLRRLLTNPIIVANLLGIGTILIPIIGVSTFLPKYLEARFRQTASQANIFTGLTGQTMIMIGTFLGGVIVWKFKPRALYVAGWTAVVDVVYALGFAIVMNFDCNDVTIEGVSFTSGQTEVTSMCSKACNCDITFDPVCLGNGQSFLSPCLAGCTEMATASILNATKNVFYNCSCGGSEGLLSLVQSGFCEDSEIQCTNLFNYIAVLGAVKLIATSTRVGFLMVIIRSVAKQDKGVSLTLMSVAGSILGFIPGPIIYGAVVDSTCLIWEDSDCNNKGNCWLYDVNSFSIWFHGLSIGFISLTVILDIVVTFYARNLNLYDEDPEDDLSTDDGLTLNTIDTRQAVQLHRLSIHEQRRTSKANIELAPKKLNKVRT